MNHNELQQAQEKALVEATVAEGLCIQDRFRPEPTYKKTGKGHYKSDTIEEMNKAKAVKSTKPEPQR